MRRILAVLALLAMLVLLALSTSGCSWWFRDPTQGSAPPTGWNGEIVQAWLRIEGTGASAPRSYHTLSVAQDTLRAYVKVVSATDYTTIQDYPKDIKYDPIDGEELQVPIATGADYIASVIIHEGNKLVALDMDRAFVPEGSPPDLITLEPHAPTYTATVPSSVRRSDAITPRTVCARSDDPMILGSVAVLIGWREWDNNGDRRDRGTSNNDVIWTVENCINYGPDTFKSVPEGASELYYQIRVTNQGSYGGGTFYAAYFPDLDVEVGLPTIAVLP